MRDTTPRAARRGAATAGERARRLAALSLVVLAAGAALFAGAWLVGGEAAVSDSAVGMTVAVAWVAALAGSLAALVLAGYDGVRHGAWGRLWLPLATFPVLVAVIGVLEAVVLE